MIIARVGPMSRGHGAWEQAILHALKKVPGYYLTDLLPSPYSRAQAVALERACRNLRAAGKLKVARLPKRADERWHGPLAVYRLDSLPPRRGDLRVRATLSVPCNT